MALANRAAPAVPTPFLRLHAPAPVRLRRRDDVDPTLLYPEHNISVPVDHFFNESKYEPHTNATFNLRYWFDTTYYKPGGPVIVLQSGETDASERLVYLQKGILYELSKATGGLGVVLEHRYYGASFPVDDLSTENLRFLTTQQALADQAYFAANIKFPGLEDKDLTAPGTPYIAYGGSYAGGFVAFLRKVYPELTWGAISSSGVTAPIYDYWEYYEPVRKYGPSDCIANQQKLINVVDNIFKKNDSATRETLKATFGLLDLTYDDDFANLISFGIGNFQSKNWDPAVNSPDFDYYCGNITSQSVLWPDTEAAASNASALVKAGGWGNESDTLTTPLLNFVGWINDSYVSTCDTALDGCFGTHNASAAVYADKSLDNYNSLSWAYQYCTEWGFIQTGSGVPKDQLPLISRLLTLEYLTLICRYAFNITSPPDEAVINQYGRYNISYPRLALIGGEADPWRPVTPLASLDVPTQINQTSTVSEPKILIQGAVHHWDGDSLLETAQPVSYHLPKVRPSVISIGSRGSSKEWKTLPSERELMDGSPVPRPPTKLQRRESTASVHSGFQACEAQLLEVPDLPDTALYMMPNASADSLAVSRAKYSAAWSPDAPPNTVRIPGHEHMNSIKNIIKSPALSRAPSLQVQHRQSSVGRPSTAVADILDDNYNPFETVPADLNEPPVRTSWKNRQASTLSCTSSGSTNVFQVPAPTSSPPAAMAPAPDPANGAQSGATRARRKSMKGLRKRGESIGQAFKMAALMARGGSKADESGHDDHGNECGSGNNNSPTLRPFLKRLPSRSELIASQRTPTGQSLHETGRAFSSFEVGDDEDEDNGEDAADDVTLEDEDFEAPPSTNGAAGPSSSPVVLQRIRSLPVSSSPPKNTGNVHPQSQLHTSQSAIALRMPPPRPPPLYPPFYNRPPTPLPPSPSLTSLLRPPSLLNRSTTSTRATTPDSSDVETPLDTEAAVAQSARRAHPLPPTSPKVPTYEYYGFVLYLASSLAFLMYILWSYLPSPFLHALGITYYPNRWWSLAIPAWIVMLLVYIYVALLSYNVEYLTLPLNSMECMVDEAGNVAILDSSSRIRKGGSAKFVEELTQKKHIDEERHHHNNKSSTGSWGKSSSSRRRKRDKDRDRDREREKEQLQQYYGFNGPSLSDLNLSWKQIWNEGTDAVMDVPIGGVCEVLYGDG
ncbi:hypothetical protein DV736_g990, partial [Chaetothyriales sp. CBS 134916]